MESEKFLQNFLFSINKTKTSKKQEVDSLILNLNIPKLFLNNILN